MVIFLFRWRSILVPDVTNLRSVTFLLPWHGIGKYIACLTYLPTYLPYPILPCLARRSDVAPSQSATLCARKSHPETITDRDVPLPNLPWKGLVFRFSPLVPRSRTPLLHTIAPFPRLISDHGSSFVRSVMGVPLLSGREHARERRQERNVL